MKNFWIYALVVAGILRYRNLIIEVIYQNQLTALIVSLLGSASYFLLLSKRGGK